MTKRYFRVHGMHNDTEKTLTESIYYGDDSLLDVAKDYAQELNQCVKNKVYEASEIRGCMIVVDSMVYTGKGINLQNTEIYESKTFYTIEVKPGLIVIDE